MQCATANYLLSARLQTISIEETVNYLDAPLSTKDFRDTQIIGEGSNRRWVASLQPHHPASPRAASNNPTPTPHPAQVAAHEGPPEDAARQFLQISRLQRAVVPCRHLGGFTDGLQSHSPLFARPPQLLAECRRSACLRHVSFF